MNEQNGNERRKDIFRIAVLVSFSIVILVTGIVYIIYATSHNGSDEAASVTEMEEGKEELIALLSSENVTIEKTDLPEPEESSQMPEPDEKDDLVTTIKVLTYQAVELKDIYSVKEETVCFKCYDKDAVSYVWEYYDTVAGEWQSADDTYIYSYPDELGRSVSNLEMNAEEDNDGLMVRCTIDFQTKEAETQTASLHVIDDIKAIAIENMETDANRYLGTADLPVTVTYKDGKEEDIIGLNGLHFIVVEENTDDVTVSGNRIETTTIIKTEAEYFNTGLNCKEALIRYRTEALDPIETTCSITGKDEKPPEISEVKMSPFEISNIDQPVNLTITITAEDDVTLYPELEYAFLYSDQELTENDWKKNPSFDVSIERNGIYYAYVRDQSGNVGKMEKEIITVDTKAPVISAVSFSEEDWCKYNTISVTARDTGEISYCFENRSAGINSGWITYSEYTADTNGIWIISVKDAVGNIAETEIEITNIDKEAPVIQRISAK